MNKVNNLDGGIHHPFHLHGRPFYLVGRGIGNITEVDVPNLVLNTTNPLRRDTLVIGGGSWAILRLITDDPGVWGLHCHIGWHLAMGKVSRVDD
jgi:FtsP/CotA-like multicopper oxidase with cupredoxin domain